MWIKPTFSCNMLKQWISSLIPPDSKDTVHPFPRRCDHICCAFIQRTCTQILTLFTILFLQLTYACLCVLCVEMQEVMLSGKHTHTHTDTRAQCIHWLSVQYIMGAPAWSAEPETGTKLYDGRSLTERERKERKQRDGWNKEGEGRRKMGNDG